MGLPIRDILLLDYLDGKPLHTKVPSYQEKVLGGNTNQRLQLLLEAGWIRQTKPQETVNMLPDKRWLIFQLIMDMTLKVRMSNWYDV